MNQFNDKGLKEVYWEAYYSNGNLWYKGNFSNDKSVGYCEEYYLNGSLYCKGEFNYDEYLGYWEWYYIDGNLVIKEFYL